MCGWAGGLEAVCEVRTKSWSISLTSAFGSLRSFRTFPRNSILEMFPSCEEEGVGCELGLGRGNGK